jgi:hypothetical protein
MWMQSLLAHGVATGVKTAAQEAVFYCSGWRVRG